MNIGKEISGDKLYRGIKYYNGFPLLAEDLHEYADTVAKKNEYLFENLIGSGFLNDLKFTQDSTGIKLDEPAVLCLKGDTVLIKNDDDKYLFHIDDLHSDMQSVIYLIGWYQHITHESTIKSYGGVRNDNLENDIIYDELGMQVSTRYQFRWDIVVDMNLPESLDLSFYPRDINGNIINVSEDTTVSLTASGAIYEFEAPDSMKSFVVGEKMYAIPIFNYDSSSDTPKISQESKVEVSGGNNLITSGTEPTGEVAPGTIWYDSSTNEFKIYVEELGFVTVSSHSKFGLTQNHTYFTVTDGGTYSISSFDPSDMLQIIYEGIYLILNQDYSLSYNQSTSIMTINFKMDTLIGERFTVIHTKLIDVSGAMSIAANYNSHVLSKASSEISSHVKLSDATDSDLDTSDGYAATPKAVKESQYIIDDTTNTKYRFGIDNGLVYIEEVI